MAPLLVRLLPLRALLRLVTPPGWLRPYRHMQADAIAAAVDRRLARPVHMRRRACLRKGLMLFHFLRLAGRPAVMHFGVYGPGNEQARMRAHCWVTVDGRAICDEPDRPHATVLSHGHISPAADQPA